MEIIKQTEGLTKKQVYQITRDPAAKAIKDSIGEHIFKSFVLYSDTKKDSSGSDSGEEVQILAIKTDTGVIATNSQTFIPQFIEAVEMLDGDFEKFEVVDTTTSKGRHCFQFRVTDEFVD